MKRWVKGMRDAFFERLYDIARKDKNVILVTSDTGAICHDKFKKYLKNQYINVGIAEQNMIGIASGLAMSGKKVFVYAIVPFATLRCYEQIKVNLCCMNLPVTVVGIGAGFDYSTLGPTHHGVEDIAVMKALPNMKVLSPCDSFMAQSLADICYKKKGPKYIRLDRTGVPLVYGKKKPDINKGFSILKESKHMYIIATGRMTYRALLMAKELSKKIDIGVIDLFSIKPLNEKGIWQIIKNVSEVVTLEEHFIDGGIGSVIANVVAKHKKAPVLRTIGIDDKFCRCYGSRDDLYADNGLDLDSIINTILDGRKK